MGEAQAGALGRAWEGAGPVCKEELQSSAEGTGWGAGQGFSSEGRSGADGKVPGVPVHPPARR